MKLSELVVEVDGNFWPKYSQHTYEGSKETKGMFSAIEPHLFSMNTMIQAGGNCGLTVKEFSDKFKTIYTFEPDPVNFYCLNLNVQSPNVIKSQSCLGKERKLVEMTNSGLESDCGAWYVSNESTKSKGVIPTIMIDDLSLRDCDLICLDVEGFEYNVLLGATATIRNLRPIICLENCQSWALRYSANGVNDSNALLKQMGYSPVSYYKTSYSIDVIYAPS